MIKERVRVSSRVRITGVGAASGGPQALAPTNETMSSRPGADTVDVLTGYAYTGGALSATRCANGAVAVHLRTMSAPPLVRCSAPLKSGVVAIGLLLTACRPAARVPDPAAALAEYTRAMESGDAVALRDMMTEESRRFLSNQDVKRLLNEQKQELTAHAKGLAEQGQVVSSTARLRYADGEVATLDEKDGRYYVTAASGLPAAARTPNEALKQLRIVLARRSYSGLLRVLTSDARTAMDEDVQSLVEGLRQPEALDVEVKGDRARVTVPGGHRVLLRRRDGVWRIEDLD